MRKFWLALFVLVVGFGAYNAVPSVQAAENPGLELTGQEWMQSSKNEKLAFLYGASSVVAIENMIAQKEGKAPTLFVQAWSNAFNSMSWTGLMDKLDAWYLTHPESQKRHVFDVLWNEFMAPALK